MITGKIITSGMNNMKSATFFGVYLFLVFLLVLGLEGCKQTQNPRVTEDFNFDWKFTKGDLTNAELPDFDDAGWERVRLPHDWSIREGYQQDSTAASTGFVKGGIGWYRKSFSLPESDKGKTIWIEFDGIYCRSTVWINGHKLGYRPNGFSSFSYQLGGYLNYGTKENMIAVKVNHSAYADARWYTGSGICRNVRLIKTSAVHIPQWGVRISTPVTDAGKAVVHIKTAIDGKSDHAISCHVAILDAHKNVVASGEVKQERENESVGQDLNIVHPELWSVDAPNLYTAEVSLITDGKIVDRVDTKFGVRSFRFDPSNGFFLNGMPMKIKGVNLHDDAGALGVAVPEGVWKSRVKKLKSIGVNAIRMSHNAHSPELMSICDQMGVLVMDECFDEWQHPKGKNLKYLGDDAAGEKITRGYSDVFIKWSERDLKDLVRRDFNHPSVILWSIGNEIEWTYPAYSKAFAQLEKGKSYYDDVPTYDTTRINKVFNKITGGVDSLSIVAHHLSKWIKAIDTTRLITCASVRPSIAMASGYGEAVDVLGMNYRAIEYDAAHRAFPQKCLIGSENWGAYSEWKNCLDRDFISGIFVWTGFAYLGEGGPWPRKGLNLSFFDFAGFKTPRGHFFECLWNPTPKVYMVTTPESESEYSYSEKTCWKFNMHYTPPPVWKMLRKWEWYKVNEYWDYQNDQNIVVQVYTNCDEAELFLNGHSLGKKALADFSGDDNIIKWLVPYQKGELKVVGYDKGTKVAEYTLHSTGKIAQMKINIDKQTLKPDNYDVAFIDLQLYDENGYEIANKDTTVRFDVSGNARLMAVDNGWERNVQPHYTNSLRTHNGRAIAIIQSSDKIGKVEISALAGEIKSNTMTINIRHNLWR